MNHSCKIALYQFNPIVGDILNNAQKIVQSATEAARQGADVLVTPAFALTGFEVGDLVYRPDFWVQVQQGLGLIEGVDGITIVVGHPSRSINEYFSTASVYRDGNRLGVYQQMVLNLGKSKYFSAGITPLVFETKGVKFGVLSGEDLSEVEPASASADAGSEVLLVLDAAAFYLGRDEETYTAAQYRVEETNQFLAYVNMVGGQDGLVFEGGSFTLNKEGQKSLQAASFEENLSLIDLKDMPAPIVKEAALPDEAILYEAMVLATRDYIVKSGFKKTCLGLSGGIDSALVLAVAADAIGAENCEVIIMPSQYTASISVEDATEMAVNLGVKHSVISITPLFEQFKSSLEPLFKGAAEDLTEENIQARVRGTLLMALSNKTGALLLSTGNKSEVAMGYCTLYGDMTGGFAPLKDLLKTQVFALSHYRNSLGDGEIIPTRIITRPPSAELRADQKDQDSLPEYELLDAILVLLMERNLSPAAIVKEGFKPEDVNKVVHLLNISEYKRSQSITGPKLSRRSFGSDWQMPICQKFKEV